MLIKRLVLVVPHVAEAVKTIVEKANVVIVAEKELEAPLALAVHRVLERQEVVAVALLAVRPDVTHLVLILALVSVAIHVSDIVIPSVMVVVLHYALRVAVDHHHLPREEVQHLQ